MFHYIRLSGLFDGENTTNRRDRIEMTKNRACFFQPSLCPVMTTSFDVCQREDCECGSIARLKWPYVTPPHKMLVTKNLNVHSLCHFKTEGDGTRPCCEFKSRITFPSKLVSTLSHCGYIKGFQIFYAKCTCVYCTNVPFHWNSLPRRAG